MSLINRSLGAIGAFLRAGPDTSLVASDPQGSNASPHSGNSASEEIPVLHRLAIIYLMLPVVIWLVGWHQWWLGVPASVTIVLASWRALSGSWKVSPRPLVLVLLLLAGGWVMATAAGGVFDVHNLDWVKHRAILLDLARGDWPVRLPFWVSDLSFYFPGEVELKGYLLRYYLAYYMVPGLLGKWFGIATLDWAVALWTWCGVALILLLFARGSWGWKAIAASVIVISFSGMDIVRISLLEGWDWWNLSLEVEGWPQVELGRISLEWDERFFTRIQYSSNMVGLMWVPQHFIAGALYALLLVQLRRYGRFLGVSGVLVAGSLFWSPFVAIGILPLVAVLVVENGLRPFLRWQNLLLAMPLAGLLIGFLTSGFATVPHGWILGFGWETLLRVMPVLYLTEFLALAVLLVVMRPALLRDWFFVVSVGTLLLLPWYSYGELNDLVMRGLMPALIVFCYYCAQTVLGGAREPWGYGRAVLTGMVVMVLSVGVVTVAYELARANNDHDFGVFRFERLGTDFSVLRDLSPYYQNQYVAHEVTWWYDALLGESGGGGGRLVGKGALIIQSEYDVYLNEHRLIYVKGGCGESEEGTQFFVEALPVEEGTLPGNQEHHSFNFEFVGHSWRVGETCVAVRELPWWFRVGHIKTGQLNLERTGHRWLGHYYSEAYRDRLLGKLGEPVIRSRFDVYVKEKSIIYTKAACSEEDVAEPFVVRVEPVALDDLREDERQQGFAEVTFAFGDFGGWLGGSCLLVYEMPHFAIAKFRTGQYVPGGGHVWEGSYTLEQ